jgi:hypothetical protein
MYCSCDYSTTNTDALSTYDWVAIAAAGQHIVVPRSVPNPRVRTLRSMMALEPVSARGRMRGGVYWVGTHCRQRLAAGGEGQRALRLFRKTVVLDL